MQLHQKIIHLLAQLALLKYQSLQGCVKEMYAKEEIEGAKIQGKSVGLCLTTMKT